MTNITYMGSLSIISYYCIGTAHKEIQLLALLLFSFNSNKNWIIFILHNGASYLNFGMKWLAKRT